MKNKILTTIFLILLILLIGTITSQAKVITNDPTVKSGETVTINITSQELVDGYKISISSNEGLTFVSASGGTLVSGQTVSGVNPAGMTDLAVYKFKAPEVSKDTTYKVTFLAEGVIPHGTEEKTSNTPVATVTVKANVQTPTQQPETQKPTNTTPTVTEPKFTDANKTMYATGDINLRSSWSTSSSATQVAKGTELKVTGTSTEKVNGYVWYRVSYNGATKYVASSLLTSTKPEEEKKSDNAYLKSLTVEGQELLPEFSKDTTSYTMQVESDVTELNIKAEAEDSKATVEIKGNTDLKEGENTVTISVNAEDNTIKIYEITVTKSEKIALGLKSLTIEGTDIANDFKTGVYEYEIEIDDVTELEIEAIANDETATVEILGNEDLQEGENNITIIVSSEDGEEKVTYQITANKIVERAETIVEETAEQFPKLYLYIALGALLLIALIIVIVYTIKHRNTDEYEFSDNFESLPKELPEENENKEETQELDLKNEKLENYEEINKEEDRKTKIDYFLDDVEEEKKPRRKKGKHF